MDNKLLSKLGLSTISLICGGAIAPTNVLAQATAPNTNINQSATTVAPSQASTPTAAPAAKTTALPGIVSPSPSQASTPTAAPPTTVQKVSSPSPSQPSNSTVAPTSTANSVSSPAKPSFATPMMATPQPSPSTPSTSTAVTPTSPSTPAQPVPSAGSVAPVSPSIPDIPTAAKPGTTPQSGFPASYPTVPRQSQIALPPNIYNPITPGKAIESATNTKNSTTSEWNKRSIPRTVENPTNVPIPSYSAETPTTNPSPKPPNNLARIQQLKKQLQQSQVEYQESNRQIDRNEQELWQLLETMKQDPAVRQAEQPIGY